MNVPPAGKTSDQTTSIKARWLPALFIVPAAFLALGVGNLLTADKADAVPVIPADAANQTVHMQPSLTAIANAAFYDMAAPTGEQRISAQLKPGDTLAGVLHAAGVNRLDTVHAISALSKVYSPRKLRAGQQLQLVLNEPQGDDAVVHLAGLSTRTSPEETIVVSRTSGGEYKARNLVRETHPVLVRANGTINSSLYLDALDSGASDAAIVEFARLYAYQVDFQRGIHPGDKFDMVFDRYEDERGTPVKTGDMMYAELVSRGKAHKLYRFVSAKGEIGYYDAQGHSARRFLMKTPINGARITSAFGWRKHPVLGYTKKHKGVDFHAAIGTPIMAAGNGVIERASRWSTYGNYIRIRHSNGFKTAYAHLSKYAKGIHKGVYVQQGQIIGYTGATGRVTGPHLHYEVIKDGHRVNPMTVKLPSGRKLKPSELPAFEKERARIDTLVANAKSAKSTNMELASTES